MTSGKRYSTLYRYLTKEYMFAFMIGFIFYFSIFFVNQLLVIAKNILIASVSFIDVIRILIYSVPIILAYVFPFASLSGTAMMLGDLASNNEILALRSHGISFWRLLQPLLVMSLLVSALSFFLNDVFLPLGTIEYKKLYKELLYSSPELELEAQGVTRFGKTLFKAGEIDEGIIYDLVIFETSTSGVRTIIAKEGRILEEESSSDRVTLLLQQVSGLDPRGRGLDDFDVFNAETMVYTMFLSSVNMNFLSVSPNEMSSIDLFRSISEKKDDIEAQRDARIAEASDQRTKAISWYQKAVESGNPDDFAKSDTYFTTYLEQKDVKVQSRSLQYMRLEFFKKTALPLACTIFVIFAFPLSTTRLKNGRLLGFGLGVVISTLYWFILFAAQAIGSRTFLPPLLLMWLPNLIFAATGIMLFGSRRVV